MTDFARDLFAANPLAWLIGAAVVLALIGVIGLGAYADRMQKAKDAEREGSDFWSGGGAL
jgi:hypothetical protein